MDEKTKQFFKKFIFFCLSNINIQKKICTIKSILDHSQFFHFQTYG